MILPQIRFGDTGMTRRRVSTGPLLPGATNILHWLRRCLGKLGMGLISIFLALSSGYAMSDEIVEICYDAMVDWQRLRIALVENIELRYLVGFKDVVFVFSLSLTCKCTGKDA